MAGGCARRPPALRARGCAFGRRQQVPDRLRHLHAILDMQFAQRAQGGVAQRGRDHLARDRHVLGGLLGGQPDAGVARQLDQQFARDELAHQQRADGGGRLLDAFALVRRQALRSGSTERPNSALICGTIRASRAASAAQSMPGIGTALAAAAISALRPSRRRLRRMAAISCGSPWASSMAEGMPPPIIRRRALRAGPTAPASALRAGAISSFSAFRRLPASAISAAGSGCASRASSARLFGAGGGQPLVDLRQLALERLGLLAALLAVLGVAGAGGQRAAALRRRRRPRSRVAGLGLLAQALGLVQQVALVVVQVAVEIARPRRGRPARTRRTPSAAARGRGSPASACLRTR